MDELVIWLRVLVLVFGTAGVCTIAISPVVFLVLLCACKVKAMTGRNGEENE